MLDEVNTQRRRLPAGPRPRPVGQSFTVNVGYAEGGEVGDRDRDPTSISHKSGDAQRKASYGVEHDLAIPREALSIPKQPSSITMFQGASNFQISNVNFTAIGGNATIIRFGDGEFTELQRNLIGDYIAKHIELPGITNNLNKHILTQSIITLPRAEAVFDDYQTKKKTGPCFEGTRVALLRELADWVTGQDGSRMYILSGLAGIGKSTVAYTVASRAADLNLLGASFFFSRDEADRNSAKKLFTTIAYQLCTYDERISKAIGDALKTERGSAATTKGPQEQLRALILDPLCSILQSRPRPILVVVDALDECDGGDVLAVIQGLSQLVRDLPSFKVILTTRPQSVFDHLLSNQSGRKLFRLQDIEDKIVDGDIRLYLKHNLSLENVKMHFRKRQWGASDKQIDLLVRAAGRLFIMAATSVRYILDKSAANPASQMQELLHAGAQNRTPFKDLNHFYTIILRNAVPTDCDNLNTINRYQLVVGAIILVQSPLPVSVLASLIEVDVEEIHAVLDHLQSVILVDDDEVPRVYHKSFPDYLTDEARCRDSHLRIDPKTHHTRIAVCCFEMADKHLKYNILGLGTPARFMNNEDGFEIEGITDEELLEKIPQQLRYACVYWVAHFELASIEDSDILNELDKFANRHTLHWFEVLSIIGQLDTAHRAIRNVLTLLKPTSSDLNNLLSDALRFISKFYGIIYQSALHTYYSALPFCPTDSVLYHRYIKEAAHGIFDVEGGPKKWDALIADLDHGQGIDAVKFSLNSAMLVSYSYPYLSEQGTSKIWDAFTGTPISTIPGDTFAISSDFSTIVSSKDNVITYYNNDGSTTGATVTTSSEIKTLALSSESNRVAAALSDGTVYLWESRNGELIDRFYGHEDRMYWHGLRFSPSGTRIVYATAKGIELRDGISGGFIADLQWGSWDQKSLEFSADGSRIASLSCDRDLTRLTVWNGESGKIIGAAGDFTNHGHSPLAISANGSLLATVDGDNVMLWNENYGQLINIKTLECERPIWITFSLDNKLAFCNSSGIRIYNVETLTVSALLSRKSVGHLAFSPDSTRLVCGTHLCEVQLFDVPPSRTLQVIAIALSRDCTRLCCGYSDTTVELWKTSPTMRRIASHQVYDLEPGGLSFGPDGRLFASWSRGGTIKLWNGGDGSLYGTLGEYSNLRHMALSNSAMLIVAGYGEVALWDLDTLSFVHTFGAFGRRLSSVSISDQGDLAAVNSMGSMHIRLFDLENRTPFDTFNFLHHEARTLTFLPDKSHLIAQSHDGKKFLSLNLVNKQITNEPMLEHLIQLRNIPLWHGVPISLCHQHNSQHYISALFFQDQRLVPVIWIPTDIIVANWTQGSSMIVLGCEDGRIIILRLRTSYAN